MPGGSTGGFGLSGILRNLKGSFRKKTTMDPVPEVIRAAAGRGSGDLAGVLSTPAGVCDACKMLMSIRRPLARGMPLSATTPQAGSLAEMGGKLYQQATYVNGLPCTFQSSLPVAGVYATDTYPTPGPLSLQVNVSGQGAAQFVAGQVVTPDFVQSQWSSAAAGSNGRTQNSALMQQPGLVIS